MKALLFILFLGGPLFAHAEYEFYGKLGAGYERSQGFRQPTTIINNKLQEVNMIEDFASRIGVRGSEALENGKLIWQIEQYITLGNNAVATYANGFANRDSFIGLSADWGTLRLGRLSNFPNMDMEFIAPYEYYGGSNTLYNFMRLDSRLNSAIRYDSPMYGEKFRYMLLFSPDEERTGGYSKDVFNVGLFYQDADFFLGYSYLQKEKTNSGSGQDSWHRLETGYDNKKWMVVLGAQQVKGYSAASLVYNEGAYKAQFVTLPTGEIEATEYALTAGWYLDKDVLYVSAAQGANIKVEGTDQDDSGYSQYVLGWKRSLSAKAYVFTSGGIVQYKGKYASTTDDIVENSIAVGLFYIF